MGFPFQKKHNSDSDSANILNIDFYEHKAILNAMNAPIRALETDKFNDGLISVQLSVSLLEQFAWAGGTIRDEEPDLVLFLVKEKKKMSDEGITDLGTERARARLAYTKMAWIFRKLNLEKPSKTDFKV